MAPANTPFPATKQPQPILCLAALAIAMTLSRPYPLTGIVHMSDASNAVFFIGGLLALPRSGFLGLLLLSVALDVVSIGVFGSSDFCVSPAYGFLWLAYAALWLGGRRLANTGTGIRAGLRLLVAFLVLQCLTHLLSSGSFYFLSGKFSHPDLSGLLSRTATYLPSYVLRDFWYVLFFVLLRQATVPPRSEVYQ